MFKDNIIETVKKKALKSICRYRVGAIGISSDGRILKTTFNKHRFNWRGGGLHAEMEIMKSCGKNLKSILICRVNAHGKLLKIDPCKVCREKARELNVKIYSTLEM
jgi:cytidine deaminase